MRKLVVPGLLALLALADTQLQAQVCRITVAGLNRNRKVFGPVNAECPGGLHSAPFGNWGVTSNLGKKVDGHQFDGWCHDSYACDSRGNCGTTCIDGWYEWNSCTSHPLFLSPNCTLYNSPDCTSQLSTTGLNIHSSVQMDIPVSCPRDTNFDQKADAGGCADLSVYDPGSNFLSLYELDPVTPDELVQTLYFPPTPVVTNCGPYGCGSNSSDWVAPIAYDSPTSPPRVYTEISTLFNSGEFVDSARKCAVVAPGMYTLLAASYALAPAAPDSIVSSFGNALASRTEAVTSTAPSFQLGGIRIEVVETASGVSHPAQLLLASPTQINWIMPSGIPPGEVSIRVRGDASAILAAEQLEVRAVSPGLFSADSTGSGPAAALAVRALPGGTQAFTNTFQCANGACTTVPLDAANGDLYLVLFGTGIRGSIVPRSITATIGGDPVEVTYAGAQNQFPGLDQVNLHIPATLAGRGVVSVKVIAAGIESNPVSIDLR